MYRFQEMIRWLLLAFCACPSFQQGTTPFLKDIFIGRCKYFKQFGYDSTSLKSVDCNSTWNAFFGAFAHKDQCDVTTDDFKDYFKITNQKLPAGKTAFWSGTQQLSQLFSSEGLRAYTVRQTMMGFLVDELNWCGSKTDPSGLNLTSCPRFSWTDCHNQAMGSFWSGASEQYALQSSGSMYLLLNGSKGGQPAYVNTSFFALHELPSLKSPDGPMEIMVAQSLGSSPTETCNNGSLLALKKILTEKGISFTCRDNPPIVKHLLCGFAIGSFPECEFALAGGWCFRSSIILQVALALAFLLVCG